ncbi:MAG: 50S ribosomal protein L9 [Oscillospiraceae bacterium]|nr:50S ribosomal protein L9 [Oscillospiraceae bacterium]
MKVVLKTDVKGTGKKDELVEVSDGYARNFLFPRKLAVAADAAAVNDVRNKEAARQHHKEEEEAAARALAAKIDGGRLTVHAKAGSGGRLFGAVTAKDIAAAAASAYGVEVDKRKIVLTADIKSYGSYPVEFKVYPGVSATVTVSVEE